LLWLLHAHQRCKRSDLCSLDGSHLKHVYNLVKKFETFQLEPDTFLRANIDQQLHSEKRFTMPKRGLEINNFSVMFILESFELLDFFVRTKNTI
jgi:hypothetical protein